MKKLGLALIVAAGLCSACTQNVPYSLGGPVDISAATKEGRAECKFILGFPKGNCSIRAAAEAGGITNILFIDQEVYNALFYAKKTTIVYGN